MENVDPGPAGPHDGFGQSIYRQKGAKCCTADRRTVWALCVQSGVLRAYTISDEGREITLYRLYQRDVCLFSASCAMRAVDFDIFIEADQESFCGSFRPRYTGS